MDATRIRNRVSTVDDALSPAECQQMLRRAEAVGYTAAPITTAFGFVMRPDIRNNTRVILDDVELARWLWARISPVLAESGRTPEPVGVNERFRFYRYERGQFFDWHRDGAFRRNDREWSTLTLLIYLDDAYKGGRTKLEGIGDIEPRPGRVLIFPHGLRHRGSPVTAGVKHVMRTDVMVRDAR